MTAPAPHLARCAALSSDGRHLVLVEDGGIVVSGVRLDLEAVAAEVVNEEVWCIARGSEGHRLERLGLDGERRHTPTLLGELGDDVRLVASRRGTHALVSGQRELELRGNAGELIVTDLGPRGRDARILVPGRGVLERRGNALVLLRAGRVAELALPLDGVDGHVISGAVVLDGALIAVGFATRSHHALLTFDARRGHLHRRARLSDATVLAVAERAGVLVIGGDRYLTLLDLRLGKCRCERVLAAPVRAVATDETATRIVVVDDAGQVGDLGAMLDDCREPAPVAETLAEQPDLGFVTAPVPEADAEAEAEAEVAPDRSLVEASGWVLRALGPLPATGALSDDALARYLADVHAWISALCRSALAMRNADGAAGAAAHEHVATAALAAWRVVPHLEVARELSLSPLATKLLLLVAAPQIWGELSGAYGAVTADRARPRVDELLLAHLLGAGTKARAAIAEELDEDAPLVASGAVVVAEGLRPYAALSAHPAIARRLAGARIAGDAHAPCPLDAIVGPQAELVALARSLVEPGGAPPRVVLRGRRGSGRRTVAAALAAQAGRAIRCVSIDGRADCDRRLRQALRDASLRGDLPCVSFDDLPEDPVLRRQVGTVLDAHRTPMFVRAPLDGELPLDPGYALLEIAPLDESRRRELWRSSLADRGADAAVADELAARFAVGPGVVARACAAVDSASADDLAACVRQHRSARIGAIAKRVSRLAAWSDLVVVDEIADSLRELVARVKYRRTVLEGWGMDDVAATAQAVTGLFQGGPGTGKTMAAGVIARELGYELWRVDLSKVVSKWIGETEKNLGAVFDAAEDGEIVLLFDEADSLFGKRTDVKSSHDRNANLETNYLLQRLDVFTGIAILTTNFGTSIDPAFKRRLTVQVQFPFPDEAERERLWRAHLPSRLPVAGDLDLASLARKYPLSGGYIRNAALRAAYLAAAESAALSQDHLHRAVTLEYQRNGNLAQGRLE